MGKPHKYHRSRLEIDTSLSGDRVLELARQVVEAQSNVHLAGAVDDAMLATVKSWTATSLLQFKVAVRAGGERTHVATEILSYRTSQPTYMFIPVGPKSMQGYGIYRSYMQALQQVVRAADPSARCAVTERDAA